MISSPFTKKALIFSVLFSLIIVAAATARSIFDSQTKIVFCDVGQGDAIYIRVKNKVDVLIDAGPDRRILVCLGRFMPFYDRRIEMAFISHPESDHFGGFLYLAGRYRVEKIAIGPLDKSGDSFQQLKKLLAKDQTEVISLRAGDQINLEAVSFNVLWPSVEYVTKQLIYDRPRSFSKQILGASSKDSNFFSLILQYHEDSFGLLLPGDSPKEILDKLSEKDIQKTTVLKIPHHGSKTGLSNHLLQLANPTLAVISAGKNNNYGHPHQQVLDTLKALGIKVRRTDKEGDIVFKINN